MSMENVLQTLVKEQAKAQALADTLAASIKALGGSVNAGAGKPIRKRKGGGWPKGKPRGKKNAGEPGDANEAAGDVVAPANPSPIAEARAKRAGKPGASLAAAAS